MPSTPYRTLARSEPEPHEAEPSDLAPVVTFVWLVALSRVAAGILRADPSNTELALAWLFVLAAPSALWIDHRATTYRE